VSEYGDLYRREATSIREFLLSHADKLGGRVLDLGCGKMPYRDIVEMRGGHYEGFDSDKYGGSVIEGTIGAPQGPYDAIICTQVIQYVNHPVEFLASARGYLDRWGPGVLLMTGPTNWPVTEPADIWRLTPGGIAELLSRASFTEIEVRERHAIRHSGRAWVCGWTAVARA
jgi:hypothetical protein